MNILRTTSFRLTLIFIVMLIVYGLILVWVLMWNARNAYHDSVSTIIETEAVALAEAYRVLRLPGLIRALNGRIRRPGASLLLLADRNGEQIIGNISNVSMDVLSVQGIQFMPYERSEHDDDDVNERENRRRADSSGRQKEFRNLLPPLPDREERRQRRDKDRRQGAGLLDQNDESFGPNSLLALRRQNQQDANASHMEGQRLTTRNAESTRSNSDDHDLVKREAMVRVFRLQNGVRLLVGRDLSQRDYFAQGLRQAALTTVILTLLSALIGGLYISKRVLSRIEDVSDTANRIMAGDLNERMPVKGSNDEFDRLSASLNDMLARLDQLMQGMKEVSDNIAHDLKTPLTRMRTRIETALRDENDVKAQRRALEVAMEDADQLISTFNALLNIARLEAGNTSLELGAIDVSAITNDVVELYEPFAEDIGLPMQVDIAPGLIGYGHRELLAQAISNLVDNAIKYGIPQNRPADSDPKPLLLVNAFGHENGVTIEVSDRGDGIPLEDRERVLERFVRLEKSRTSPGNGLGLSMVRAIIGLHKGVLTLSPHNPGVKAIIELPKVQLAVLDKLGAGP